LALINVVNDSSNSSTPCFKIVPDALGDEDDIDIESDRPSPGSSGVHASSGFTASSALDDIKNFDVTSRPWEHQE
jgi:hypothetical protein